MSIPEAAHLVLNAGTFATGGDVFLLDMGDPVKIVDLAKSMIRQHGLQPVLASEIAGRQKWNNGILIEFSGLRPGEKLYEELLIDGVAQETLHPKILKSHDGVLEGLDLAKALRLLEDNIQNGGSLAIIKQLRDLPLSYVPNINPELKQTSDGKANQVKTVKSENSLEKNASSNLVTHQERVSLLMRVISSKLGLAVLHRYFLWTRGMTLGVRILVQNSEGKILLVKHSYVPGWHLPGGGVDHGEDVETAARREVYEETGISELGGFQFTCLSQNNSVSDRDHVTYFKARTNQTPSTKRNSEITAIQFVSRDVAAEIIAPEHKIILENS